MLLHFRQYGNVHHYVGGEAMQISTFSSRDFNQRVAVAKKAARGDRVVYILDRGQPAHVLMSFDKFRELSGQGQNILQLLSMPEAADIDFEIERSKDFPRSVDY
jgi:PHD/YefM family antitoxin component YafN of YafNO toxin-antitoxin module